MKQFIKVFVVLGTTGVLTWYAFKGSDLQAIWELLKGVNYLLLFPFMLCLGAMLWANAYRVTLLMSPLGRFSVKQVTPSMMIGFGANNLLPARLGEIIRILAMAKQFQVSKASLFTMVVLERLLDVFAILLFFLLTYLLITPFPDPLLATSHVMGLSFTLVTVGILFFVYKPVFFEKLWRMLTQWIPSISDRGAQIIHQLSEGLGSIKSFKTLALSLAFSLIRWFLSSLLVWISLYAFGVEVDLLIPLVVIAVSAIALTLPNAPGFFGAMQAVFVFALPPFGVTQEIALAASIFYLLMQWIPITLIGGYYYLKLKEDIAEDLEEAIK